MFRFVFAIFIDGGENFSHSNQIPVPDLCYPTNLNVCEENYIFAKMHQRWCPIIFYAIDDM